MDKNQIANLKITFDELAHTDEQSGVEFWYARELMPHLGYTRWENFAQVVNKAMTACYNSANNVENHFRDITKMVSIGYNVQRGIKDIKLTRYACYLIAQNGDPRKEEIAFAQSYFAQQTRKQELIEEHMRSLQRLDNREKLRESEKRLSKNIYDTKIHAIATMACKAAVKGNDRLSFQEARSFIEQLLTLELPLNLCILIID